MLQTTSASEQAISVLYLFAGKPRQGDMTQCLQQQATGYKLRVTCVDIQRRPTVDLAKSKERQKLLARIRAQEFDAILLSPPCSTFRERRGLTSKVRDQCEAQLSHVGWIS